MSKGWTLKAKEHEQGDDEGEQNGSDEECPQKRRRLRHTDEEDGDSEQESSKDGD